MGAIVAGAAVGHRVCPREGHVRAPTRQAGLRETNADTGGPARGCRRGVGGAGKRRTCSGAQAHLGAAVRLKLCVGSGGRTWSRRARRSWEPTGC